MPTQGIKDNSHEHHLNFLKFTVGLGKAKYMKKETVKRKVYYLKPSEIKEVAKLAKAKKISASIYVRQKLGFSTDLLV